MQLEFTTQAEATELAMRIENPRNIVLLPPETGDQSDQVWDNEELAQDMNSAFEPAGTLEVEEDLLVDDISDASVSTSEQQLTTFLSLMMIFPTPNQLVKEEKQHPRNNRKGRIHLNGP